MDHSAPHPLEEPAPLDADDDTPDSEDGESTEDDDTIWLEERAGKALLDVTAAEELSPPVDETGAAEEDCTAEVALLEGTREEGGTTWELLDPCAEEDTALALLLLDWDAEAASDDDALLKPLDEVPTPPSDGARATQRPSSHASETLQSVPELHGVTHSLPLRTWSWAHGGGHPSAAGSTGRSRRTRAMRQQPGDMTAAVCPCGRRPSTADPGYGFPRRDPGVLGCMTSLGHDA